MDSELLTAKLVAMAVLFAVSLFLGLIPIKLSHWFKWDVDTYSNPYVRFLLCAGGGVLLCTTFLHLLPEVGEAVDESEFPDIGLPWPELLLCVGFFIIYVIEELVHVILIRNDCNEARRNSTSTIMQMNADKHSHHEVEANTLATLRGFFTVLALSLHAIFEGLSAGLESSPAAVWYMFAAIASHKFVIGFCIGVKYVTSGLPIFLTVLYITVFSVVSSLGIGIGLAVSADTASDTVVPSVVLQGIAAGTLLYVVFFEILTESRRNGLREFFGVLLGFVIMMGLTLIES